MPIKCDIVSQDRVVYQGEADMVLLPGVTGQMGVLPNHAPLLSTLKFGIIELRSKSSSEFFTVAGGVVEVTPNQVTVLADAAENVREIDIRRAEEAQKRAETLLEQGPPPEDDAFERIEIALRRSRLRLEAAQRYRRGGRQPKPGPGDQES